ncbi:MAG: metal-dependent transcriptional regulator [Clostridia bacterium]|jgi:Mn-dependent DtxR family transcriptional regulator|nr:metal-dependent transcriptional regulator [Clostridia bacterium]
MEINKSAEDYLEMMLMLQEKYGYIRSIDIAEELNVTKPSVSFATKKLRESGYITMDKDHMIFLTDKGKKVATAMYERHKFLADFLISLGVNPSIARIDACKIEHDLSDESFRALQRCKCSDKLHR